MSELITEIKNEYLSVSISNIGAELKSIKKNGNEFLWNGDPNVWSCQAPLLFPICGGLRDDKFIYDDKEYSVVKHGFARFYEFKLTNKTEISATYTLSANEKTLAEYPFEFKLSVTYTLHNSEMEIRYDVTNNGEKTMYFSIGSHEGYSCPNGIEECSLIFEKEENLNSQNVDGPLLSYSTTPIAENTRELPLKWDYFTVDALVFPELNSRKITLKNNRTKSELTVSFEDFESVLIWTKPGANFLCIEPWCGFPDYVDSDGKIEHKKGIIVLNSGKTDTRIHKISL